MSAADIVRATSVEVVPGLELLDGTDTLIQDITDDFIDGEVQHDNEADLPGTAKFALGRAFNWESQRFRPYLTLTDLITGESMRWNMGVYIAATPDIRYDDLDTYEVEAFDKLSILDSAYGSTFMAASGDNFFATIEGLLGDFGETGEGIDQSASGGTLTADMVWPIDDENTYLRIVNDLLDAVGYTKLYSDRDGRLSAFPVADLVNVGAVFSYSTSGETIIAPDLTKTIDIYATPNKWVFVNDNPSRALPSEGDGIYTVINQSDGTTSVDARGRIVTKVVKLDAADQTVLTALGDAAVLKDRQAIEEVELSTSANPIHWHHAVATLTAPELGIPAGTRFTEVSWSHPLRSGGKVSRTLRRTVAA